MYGNVYFESDSASIKTTFGEGGHATVIREIFIAASCLHVPKRSFDAQTG